ncbi:MAG TPA: tyrosine-type recombinase/integrase [Verrucomicrobiae bacterium]|nr:tyrosine-type recombinase/integrase [Verrucomicrobiae bacterium]
MKNRFILYRRKLGGMFYVQDTKTRKQESLGTKIRSEATTLFNARNEAARQPQLNLQIAKAYLAGSDFGASTRTWQDAFNAIIENKTGVTKDRWQRGARQKAFELIHPLIIVETKAEQLSACLRAGTVSTNVLLRELHNFCLSMGWLPWPIIPKRLWPKIEYQPKRAITAEEHRMIIGREKNVELRALYELCWHLGGSQTDIANLAAENIDWPDRVVSYARRKTGSPAFIHFGPAVESILRSLPTEGLLFPKIALWMEKHRAKEFKRRCLGLGIQGVSLHSYRYAWAERAKTCGYPERFAQEALGHNSKAVHRAYARKAQVRLPSLESYERQAVEGRIIQLPPLSSEMHTNGHRDHQVG